jgi:hypothetical protein
MRLYAKPLWIPKKGNSTAEYEDAFWPRQAVESSSEYRFAIADGATETSFSGIWAKQLVRAYCKGNMESPDLMAATLDDLRRQWWHIVERKNLPWYASEKLKAGTYAALLGLTLNDKQYGESEGTWVAIAIGDSCLVQVRADTVVATFPITESGTFSSRPALVSTSKETADHQKELSWVKKLSGQWRSEDRFFLMTDALAFWFLRENEQGRNPWIVLRDVDHDRRLPFAAHIEKLRASGAMRNDDVTLYRIELD